MLATTPKERRTARSSPSCGASSPSSRSSARPIGASPRPRTWGRARASPSRSGSTRQSSGSPACGAIARRIPGARVAMARDRELAVDAVEVRDTAQEALALLKQAQAIRTTLSHIKTSSDKARGGLDELVESVRTKIERIDALVAVAEPE